MTPKAKQDIRNALRTMVENHAATMTILQAMLNDLSAQLDSDRSDLERQPENFAVLGSQVPAIDGPMLSVVHRGKRCFLGNTIPYRLIVKLISKPNRYFSYHELTSDVWDGVRSEAAIRSVVKVLRAKLRKSRLHDLAAAIDGSVAKHYGLILDRIVG